jgi:DNA primase small subunit
VLLSLENTSLSVRSQALDHLRSVFTDLILEDQDLFSKKENWEALLELMPVEKPKTWGKGKDQDKEEESVADKLRRKWTSDPSRASEDKWDDFKNLAKKTEKGTSARVRISILLSLKLFTNVTQITMQAAMEDIVLQYTYPRIDAEVSKHRNHLLKAPFCIHPKTGRVCVPVDPERIEDFKPEEVPTVGQLMRELDEWSGDAEKHGTLHWL